MRATPSDRRCRVRRASSFRSAEDDKVTAPNVRALQRQLLNRQQAAQLQRSDQVTTLFAPATSLAASLDDDGDPVLCANEPNPSYGVTVPVRNGRPLPPLPALQMRTSPPPISPRPRTAPGATPAERARVHGKGPMQASNATLAGRTLIDVTEQAQFMVASLNPIAPHERAASALASHPTVYLFDAKDDRWTDVPIRTFIQKCSDNGRNCAHPDAAPRDRRRALHRNRVLTTRPG